MKRMSKREELPPFSCTHSPNLPALLNKLGCTIAVSTYQAGKLIFVSATDDQHLIQLPRSFKRAMGVAIQDSLLAIATTNEIITFVNSPQLAATYPSKPRTYDALYVPRVTYYTGHLDMHDLHYGTTGLWGINTSFSCLCQVDENYSFRPKWQPYFIDALASEDRCHLNGLAMHEGAPLYVSALGRGNTFQSWRDEVTTGGVVMHVPSNTIIAEGLAMPHAPRVYDGELYVLQSAKEEIIVIDPNTGKYDTVVRIPGFIRGMAKHENYLFVGTSRLRKSSSTFKQLNISPEADIAGVTVVHLPTGRIEARLEWLTSVDEVYDVQILPNVVRPNIINTYGENHNYALMLPDATYWARPAQNDL